MSNDNYPQNADTVTEDFVKEICPDFLSIFLDALKEADYKLENFAKCVGGSDPDGDLSMDLDETKATHLIKLFDGLCGAFHGITNLELSLDAHDALDRGDEVNGYFWTVDGVWMRTRAGNIYKDEITRKVWNVFG